MFCLATFTSLALIFTACVHASVHVSTTPPVDPPHLIRRRLPIPFKVLNALVVKPANYSGLTTVKLLCCPRSVNVASAFTRPMAYVSAWRVATLSDVRNVTAIRPVFSLRRRLYHLVPYVHGMFSIPYLASRHEPDLPHSLTPLWVPMDNSKPGLMLSRASDLTSSQVTSCLPRLPPVSLITLNRPSLG